MQDRKLITPHLIVKNTFQPETPGLWRGKSLEMFLWNLKMTAATLFSASQKAQSASLDEKKELMLWSPPGEFPGCSQATPLRPPHFGQCQWPLERGGRTGCAGPDGWGLCLTLHPYSPSIRPHGSLDHIISNNSQIWMFTAKEPKNHHWVLVKEPCPKQGQVSRPNWDVMVRCAVTRHDSPATVHTRGPRVWSGKPNFTCCCSVSWVPPSCGVLDVQKRPPN